MFLVGAFLEKSARILLFYFLVQTLIGLGGTQVSRLRVSRNDFVHLRNQACLKGTIFWSPFKLFDILQQTGVSKSPNGLPFYILLYYETVSKFSIFV